MIKSLKDLISPKVLTFKDFIGESFDTSHDIIKTEKSHNSQNVEFYYLNISKEKYRIFVESQSKEVHVGFEYYDSRFKDYVAFGIHDRLSTKEVLGLFGTILKILKQINPDLVYVETTESKKHRLYITMMSRLSKELNMDTLQHNDTIGGSYVIIRKSENTDGIVKGFSYKGKAYKLSSIQK